MSDRNGLMTADELRALLNDRGVHYTEKPIQNGVRFDCQSGEIFNVFDTGRMSFQGKTTSLTEEVKATYEGAPAPVERPREIGVQQPQQETAAPVFIVYGHDTAARDQLELILRRMKLEPIILGHLPAAGDTIIEKSRDISESTATPVLRVSFSPPMTKGTRLENPKRRNIVPVRMLSLKWAWSSPVSGDNALLYFTSSQWNFLAISPDSCISLSQSASTR